MAGCPLLLLVLCLCFQHSLQQENMVYVQNTCPNSHSSSACKRLTNQQMNDCVYHSNDGRYNRWVNLEVDLGQRYYIQKVTIYACDYNISGLEGVIVRIDGMDIDSLPQNDPNRITITSGLPRTGKKINLHKYIRPNQYLSASEVQVWVCAPDHYGWNCQHSCSPGCHDGTCDSRTGDCTDWSSEGCKPGYRGYHYKKCDQECGAGKYGKDCKHSCGKGCEHNECDKVNGSCVCKQSGGWTGERCDVCAPGHYGSNCQSCSPGCHDGTCDSETGECTDVSSEGCKPGYRRKYPKCDHECRSGRYGKDCAHSCSAGCEGNRPTCNKVDGSCVCKQSGGWTGAKCEDVDECDNHPCENGGTCQNSQGSYTCQCTAGFTGQDCEQDVDECRSHPCKNRGICQNIQGSYTCQCTAGFTGQHCGQDDVPNVDECDNNPCENGGTCENRPGSYTCQCAAGFTGQDCRQGCSRGRYGENCAKSCSAGCEDPTCNKFTGHCTCKRGWTGEKCDVCAPDHYGDKCDHSCSPGCHDGTCDSSTGECTDWSSEGCKPGYRRYRKCHRKCGSGRYGKDCAQYCSAGCEGNKCNNVNGSCVCKQSEGWTGAKCEECSEGYYMSTTTRGYSYSSSRRIKECQKCSAGCEEGTCDRMNGSCLCRPGWTSQDHQQNKCDLECEHGAYGKDCTQNCSPGCDGNCNPTDGHCQCKTGWSNSHCSECEDYKHGQDCQYACGQCLGQEVCNASTGHCPRGCVQGFLGPRCDKPEDSSSLIVGVVTPVITIVLLLLIAGAAAIFLYRRRRLSRRENAERGNDLPLRQSLGHETNQDVAEPEAHIYQNIHLDTAERGVHFVHDAADGDTTARAVVPITPRAIRAKTAAGTSSAGDVKEVSGDTSLEEESWEEEFSHEDLYASYSTVSGRCQLLDAFQRQLLDSLAALERLSQQFKSFPRGMRFDWKAGSSPENLTKNRFKQLGAYDKNRVILVRTQGDNTTDYINASYIKGAFRDREYIATQGPLQQTKSDLWLMVWQENISQIVMLTNLEENGKVKCCKYWPDVGQTVRVGQLEVKSLSEDFRADFVIRSFSLSLRGSSGTRSVQQYHYVSWPDHGVPTAVSLLDYWLHVTAHASLPVLPLVHCSAGVGRTGTYIALDIATNRKSRGLEVNVLDIVKELREQRALMIQTEAQYKFLHEIILEAYSSQNSRLSYRHLELNFSGDVHVWKSQSVIGREYQMIQQMKSWAKRNTTVAELPENVNKNRDPRNLPDDRHLAYLTDYAKGRNQYINAVFKSSLTRKQGLVLTQLPLADTVVDLWRLVEGSQVQTIVSLGPLDEDKTVQQDVAPYWPVKKGKALRAGLYTVSLTDTASLAKSITAYTLAIKSKGKSRPVQLIHYADWSGDEPGDISDVCHLVTVVRSTATKGTSPLLIQCLDGTSKSGLVGVLYDVICRMTFDETIDVFSAVHSMHQIRPNAVTEAQYHYCYKVAQQFKQSEVEYGNV